MQFCFGRQRHDAAKIAAMPRLMDYSSFYSPPALDRGLIDFTPALDMNDVMPNCTVVALRNCAVASSITLTGAPLYINDDLIPAYYGEVIGRPTATDQELIQTDGAVVADVLSYQQTNGFKVGQQVPLFADYGTIPMAYADPGGMISRMAGTVAKLGACYIGIRLYVSDMQAMQPDVMLAAAASSAGPLAGRHACFIWDYTGLGPTNCCRIGTWGFWIHVTWDWLLDRIDEAHGVVWRQAVPDGLDYEALRSAIIGIA